MNDKLREITKHLKLTGLEEKWGEIMAYSEKNKVSTSALLEYVFGILYENKRNQERVNRLKGAKIPEHWVLATYPFAKQPRLSKRPILNLYDSLDYVTKKQNIIFIGPTGVGKTGIGTSFLVQAITQGYKGRFISFPTLVSDLYKSVATHQEDRTLRQFASYDCLLIDELGYVDIEISQISLFFRLMSMRHRTKCTIITSNLGFKEWGTFLKNPQLTAALLDRVTENSHVFNMRNCISIRSKPSNKV
jgi:DNA replication protein DnaC